MALFTDFFPTGEGGLASNPGTDQGVGTFQHAAVAATDITVDFTGNTTMIGADGVGMGSIATFTLGVSPETPTEFTGVITAFTNNANGSFTVTIPGTFGTAFAENTAGIQVSFNGGAETTITGDLNILEDTVLLGDVTHTGAGFDTDAVTINIGDSTATTTLNLVGDATTIGDGTTSTTTVNSGTVNIGQDGAGTSNILSETVNIGDAGGTTAIVGAATVAEGLTVTASGLTVSAGGADITGDSAVRGNLLVTGDLDLEGTEVTLDTNITQDHALGVDANGIVRRTNKTDFSGTGVQGSLTDEQFMALNGFVATWAEGNNTDTIPASKIPSIAVAEVHAFTLPDNRTTDANGEPSISDIVGYLNSGIPGGDGGVLAGVTLSAGDTIIVTGTTAGGTLGDGRSLTYIFTNNTPKLVPASASATFANSDFHLLSSSSTVSSIIAGTNISLGAGSGVGDVTINVDLDTSNTGAILYDNGTSLAGSAISQTGTGSSAAISMSVPAGFTVNGNTSISGSSSFTVGTGQATFGGNVDAASLDVTGNVDIDGTLDVDGATSLDGLTVAEAATFNDTVTVTGELEANGGVDINLSDGESVNIDGVNDADGTLSIDVSTSFGTQGDVTFGAGTTFSADAAISTGADLNINGTASVINLAGTIDRITGSGNINISGNITTSGALSVAGNATLNGEAITIGDGTDGTTTINGATLDINSTTLDVDSTTANIDATTISLDATTGNSNFTTTNGNLTLGASGTGELRIEGAGIATATDAEPLALVIGADGQVMTSVTGGGSGGAFDLLIATDSATPGTITPGDLVVLPVITADRNIAFPTSPFAGAGFEVSNLSAVGAGSGQFRWSFGAAGDVIMGVTLPAGGFTLDDNTASFKFVYTNATYGWVIIGAS